ncbi:MAG TPA: FCD domain-containing protein [Beijerinckiaceae bacterium]
MTADLLDKAAPAGQAPLTDRAYAAIRDRILRDAAGGRLKLDTLQKELGFSSSPLREALNRLVAEGLVTADGRRGFHVAPVNLDDLADITAMRMVTEPGAFAAAVERGDDAWEAQIVASFHRLHLVERRIEQMQAARDDHWTEAHRAFHLALIAACGSRRLIGACAQLFDQSERYRRLSASFRRRPRDTSDEHRRLMEAALARSVEAPALLRAHIASTAAHISEAVRGRGA